MTQAARKMIDYRVAEVVEVLTRKSTELEESSPSLRFYARFLETGERNLYKLVQRAVSAGFRFGLSVNYRRMGIARLLIVGGNRVDVGVPVRAVYRSLDGKKIVDLYVPLSCLDRVVDLAQANGNEVHIVSIEWGSRPALATIPFLAASPDVEVGDDVEKGMFEVVRDLMARGPPASVSGRRYPADEITIAIVAKAMEDSISSIAKIAGELGVPAAKAQRKYYGLWQRRVILGYSVRCAPYCSDTMALAEVEHSDPARLAFAAAVMPPVLQSLVEANRRGDTRGTLLILTGGGSMISRALNVVRRHWGRIKRLTVFYVEHFDREYPRQVLETATSGGLCPR